jgi:hypothetical protein
VEVREERARWNTNEDKYQQDTSVGSHSIGRAVVLNRTLEKESTTDGRWQVPLKPLAAQSSSLLEPSPTNGRVTIERKPTSPPKVDTQTPASTQ